MEAYWEHRFETDGEIWGEVPSEVCIRQPLFLINLILKMF